VLAATAVTQAAASKKDAVIFTAPEVPIGAWCSVPAWMGGHCCVCVWGWADLVKPKNSLSATITFLTSRGRTWGGSCAPHHIAPHPHIHAHAAKERVYSHARTHSGPMSSLAHHPFTHPLINCPPPTNLLALTQSLTLAHHLARSQGGRPCRRLRPTLRLVK
jgi:hypothetical protein